MNKEEAQRRADRIREFREEMKLLEGQQVLALAEDQRKRVDEYHAELLNSLTREYDVDTSTAQKQMSMGMRIISLLGAMAISAAVFFFFYRIWGLLSTGVQVGILISGPILATIGVEAAARKERTLYFSTIIALVALACSVTLIPAATVGLIGQSLKRWVLTAPYPLTVRRQSNTTGRLSRAGPMR